MHLMADAVLVQRIQRVARRDRDHADVRHVVDDHLRDLTLDRFRRTVFKAGDDGHAFPDSGKDVRRCVHKRRASVSYLVTPITRLAAGGMSGLVFGLTPERYIEQAYQR